MKLTKILKISLFIYMCFGLSLTHAATQQNSQNSAPANAAVRITCSDEDKGAEITLNGKFRGECPVDIQLPEGIYKLRVVKAIDELYEKVFEQDFRLAEGNVKKIEVALMKQLSEEGKKVLSEKATKSGATIEELERLEQEKQQRDAAEKARNKAAEMAKALEEEKLREWQRKAQDGDLDSMLSYSARLIRENNNQISQEVRTMLQNASEKGSLLAKYFLSVSEWQPDHLILLEKKSSPERVVNQSSSSLYNFIESEPSFSVPNSGGTSLFHGVKVNLSCNRGARVKNFYLQNGTKLVYEDWRKFTRWSFMGGLFLWHYDIESCFLCNNSTLSLNSIKTVSGNLFSPNSDTRFEMTVDLIDDFNNLLPRDYICGFTSANKASCLQHTNGHWSARNYKWDKTSGCFHYSDDSRFNQRSAYLDY